MSTNPGPTTTYRHNICGNMAERHDSGPGIIRCGDVPQDVYKQTIIEMVEKIQDDTLLKRVYNFVSHLYIKNL